MFSISVLISSVCILVLLCGGLFGKYYTRCAFTTQLSAVAMNMPWGKTKEERRPKKWRQSKGPLWERKWWLNQYFLSVQPRIMPAPWEEGPSPRPPISKHQFQPAANTFQVSANIGTMTKIHEELKHMGHDFRLTAFFPKLGWTAPKRESETTQL